MPTLRRTLIGCGVLALLGLQAACDALIPGDRSYPAVPHREREPLAAAAAPPPPPVVATAATGSAAVPQLVAATAPAGVTQDMVGEGAQLFSTVCAACHGQGGAGTAAAPSLRDQTWLNISGNYDEIVRTIHTGVPHPKEHPGMMPPLGGGNFNDEQVRALGAYVFALSHQT